MIEAALALAVIALGLSLRRAFVRIEYLERELRGARPPVPQVPVPPMVLRPEPDLPPEGGNYRVEEKTLPERRVLRPQAEETAPESSPSESRSFRLQAEETEAESIETQIGTQWLLYIGVIAIVIGVAYFEKLAIDNQWLGETARVIQGAVLGLVLTYVGLRFARAGYALYGQMITGGGAAILYLSTYAAFNFYHLIDRPIAFALMIGITAMVAWLADRQRSQGLALFAVGGGFATPFLLPGNTDAQMALFGYDAILIAGTVLLSRRHNWPVLNIVSYLFTLFTVALWASSFYSSEKFFRTELFITLYCAMFLLILRECRRSAGLGARVSAMVLATAPVEYYLASVVILFDHPMAMLIWLVALMLAGGLASARVSVGLGLTVWVAVALQLPYWAVVYGRYPGWLVPGLATIGAVYVIALAAQLQASLEQDDFGPPAIVWLHLNGLVMFAAAYFLIRADHLAATGAVAAGFALWQWALAAIVRTRRRDQAIHFAALGFTLLSIAVALQFDGPAVTAGWAAEGAVIVALGLKERRAWLHVCGAGLFAIAAGRAVQLLVTDAPVGHVVFFNPRAASALFVTVLSYVLAWLHYRNPDAPERNLGIGAGLMTAQVVTLAFLTSEMHAYWALREWSFERQLSVSVTWATYATVLILIGLRKHYPPIRYFAIGMFAITIVKVFMVDMAELQRLYRVLSIIGLGVMLLITSYLYQRTRRRPEVKY